MNCYLHDFLNARVCGSSQPACAFYACRIPWGMPQNYVPEGYALTIAHMSASCPVMSTPSPVMHVMPRVKETIYHSDPSEGPYMYEKMDEMKD